MSVTMRPARSMAGLEMPLINNLALVSDVDQFHGESTFTVGFRYIVNDQAALSLENARLYEESEARHRVAEALAAIGRDLTQSLDVAVVGQRITDSIRQLLGLGYSRLYRLEAASAMFGSQERSAVP